MEKEFLNYTEALALKELGFDEPCFGIFMKEKLCNYASPLGIANSDSITALTTSYSDLIPQAQKDWVVAPLYQQAFRWFREKHGLYVSIVPKKSYPDGYVSGIEWMVSICGGNGDEIGPDDIFTYKEAELEYLKKLIEIVKEK